MTKDTQNIIDKSLLLNWLSSADEELSMEQLGKWIEAKTKGKYILIENNTEVLIKLLDKLTNNQNEL